MFDENFDKFTGTQIVSISNSICRFNGLLNIDLGIIWSKIYKNDILYNTSECTVTLTNNKFDLFLKPVETGTKKYDNV